MKKYSNYEDICNKKKRYNKNNKLGLENKAYKKLIEETGSITSMVTVTIIFFITILSSTYMLMAVQRKSQLKRQLSTKEAYQEEIDNANEIYYTLIGDDSIASVDIKEEYEENTYTNKNVYVYSRNNGKFSVSKDGSQIATDQSSYTLTEDGTYIISTNKGTELEEHIVKIDKTQPIVNNIEVSDVTSNSYKIKVNVEDVLSGIKQIRYSVDDGKNWKTPTENMTECEILYNEDVINNINVKIEVQDDAKNVNTSSKVIAAKYVSGVTIPEGYYYVGGTKAKGIVISDNAADDELDIGKENVRRNLSGNQWVWVPIEKPSSLYTTVDEGIALSGSTGVKTTKYTNSGIISVKTRAKLGDTSSWREPDILTSSNYDAANYATAGFSSLANMAETMKSDYEEMIKSLEKYKGFYIGRYELSANGEKTGAPQTDRNWYTFYKNCTTLASNSKVKTRMIWGLQWDVTCSWLASSGYNITDSYAWGNYTNNGVTGHGSKKNTGFSESWKANNIYDFAGNCWEFTQEAGSNVRAVRGGSCPYTGSYFPASSCTGYGGPAYTDSTYTSRPTLYLID